VPGDLGRTRNGSLARARTAQGLKNAGKVGKGEELSFLKKYVRGGRRKTKISKQKQKHKTNVFFTE
jgi:hypothetical protein